MRCTWPSAPCLIALKRGNNSASPCDSQERADPLACVTQQEEPTFQPGLQERSPPSKPAHRRGAHLPTRPTREEPTFQHVSQVMWPQCSLTFSRIERGSNSSKQTMHLTRPEGEPRPPDDTTCAEDVDASPDAPPHRAPTHKPQV